MFTRHDRPSVLLVAMLALGAPGAVRGQAPLGTAFTYQGRLTDGTLPAEGTYDLEIRLFTAAAGGTTVGATVVRNDLPVVGGLFTLSLDFGGAAFTGSARWLEVAARPGASTGAYTTLAPRQELTPSPNALFSATTPWTGLAAVPAGFADGVDNDSGGDITSVAAGTGLTGGAASGDATLAVDPAVVQSRVSGQCPPGQSIRTVNPNGTVVCEPDDEGWALGGNAGTVPALQFLGTTDAQPLVFRANNAVALRLVRGPVLPNVVGGSEQNAVAAGVDAATIAGGGGGTSPGANRVTDHYGVIGGGYGNLAGNDTGTASDAQWATVGGGISNQAAGGWSTVAGGSTNVAAGATSAIGGGSSNQALAEDAAVAGGEGNVASGVSAAVPGGFSNVAGGDQSLAGGFRARVRDAAASGDADGDEGTFVWADTAPPFAPFVSTGPNQFLIRAGGGVGINTNAPAAPLDVNGIVRSRSGGFRFPDGTTQTTAATGTGTGDITAVNTPAGGGLAGGAASGDANVTLFPCGDGLILKRTGTTWSCTQDLNSGGTVTSLTAGAGLTGGTITTTGTLGVDFAATGAASTVARSDHNHNAAYAPLAHDHMGETWSDLTPFGLRIQMSTPGSRGLWIENSNNSDAYGVFSNTTSATGFTYGVWGQAASSGGSGVVGVTSATNGIGAGTYGSSTSTSSVASGVQGRSFATSGTTSGVWGQTESTQGRGVFGLAVATAGSTTGVRGEVTSTVGFGVVGHATATLGNGVGVFGLANGTFGTGVIGVAAIEGVGGEAQAAHGTGVFGNSSATTGLGRGVMGQSLSTAGNGVYGVAFATSGDTAGVRGEANSSVGTGVLGRSPVAAGSGRGVVGVAFAPGGTGVLGETIASTGNSTGVWGQAASTAAGFGVYGVATATSATSRGLGVVGEVFSSSFQAYAVAGYAPAGAYAGFFNGRVHVNGSLSKASGSFKIDHPLDPEHKYLYHSFVESPDMKNVYDGVATTNGDGFAAIAMPDWFEALNRDFRYQLTVIGKGVWAHTRIYEPMVNGRFVIQTDQAGVQVSWQVTGIRQDPYAEAHRIQVEEEKPEAERGTYLHPQEWGQPEAKGFDAGRRSSRSSRAESEPLPMETPRPGVPTPE